MRIRAFFVRIRSIFFVRKRAFFVLVRIRVFFFVRIQGFCTSLGHTYAVRDTKAGKGERRGGKGEVDGVGERMG